MADPFPHPNCQACKDIDRLTEAYRETLRKRYGDDNTTVVNTNPHPHDTPDGGITTTPRDDGDPGPRGAEHAFVGCDEGRVSDHLVHVPGRCRCRIQDGFDRRGW